LIGQYRYSLVNLGQGRTGWLKLGQVSSC